MIRVVAAVIIENGKVFLASRPENKPPAGWEFPGGKVEKGESDAEALQRELTEELNWPVTPVKELYLLQNENLTISFILATPEPGTYPECREGQRFKWVPLTSGIPDGLLKNDVEFWKNLASNKIKI